MAPLLGRLGNGGGTTAGFGFGRRKGRGSGPSAITATGFDVTFSIGNESWAIRNTPGPASVSFSSGFTASNNVEILLVGGGGAGGSQTWGAAGGGGAGGFIFVPSADGHTILSTAGPYSINVGNGATYSGAYSAPSPLASPTVINYGVSSGLTAIAGGPGPYPGALPNSSWGQPGGSGGGSQFSASAFGSTTQSGAGDGPPSWKFGNAGGPGGSSPNLYGGGGGGAGGAGSVTAFGVGGAGKAVPSAFLPTGVPSPVVTSLGGIPTSSPAWLYFAGGGGGGARLTSADVRAGGIGGGGQGATSKPPGTNINAVAGTNGRGGGGGGGSEDVGDANGAPGGSGVIIIHWTNV